MSYITDWPNMTLNSNQQEVGMKFKLVPDTKQQKPSTSGPQNMTDV